MIVVTDEKERSATSNVGKTRNFNHFIKILKGDVIGGILGARIK
jgi:hypothetical protein